LKLFRGSSAEELSTESLPYRLRDDFLSPAELSFYRILSTVISNRAVIFTKVRLADIFFVSRPIENRSYFSRISQRHVDFLVCQPNTVQPIVGIELDDSSHNRPNRKVRDEFLDQVFEAADLPLVRMPVQQAYTAQDVVKSIEQYLESAPTETTEPDPAVAEASSQDQSPATPFCPKCGIPMVKRTVKQGKHLGKQFFGCKNYPNCREMLPIRLT
jgi:hypothetical protein